MSKLGMWLIIVFSAVTYHSFKQYKWGSGSFDGALASIYWTGLAFLYVHFFD